MPQLLSNLRRWRWLAGIVMVIIVAAAHKIPAWKNMRGPLYESSALMQVSPTADELMNTLPASPSSPSSSEGSNYMNKQKQAASSQENLELALRKSGLLGRLGGDHEAALDRLMTNVTVRQLRGADMLEISYRDEDPQLAHDAATAIYESYTERRAEQLLKFRELEIKSLEVKLKGIEIRMNQLRISVKKIARSIGLSVSEQEGDILTNLNRFREMAEKERYIAKREKAQLALQLVKFLNLDDSERANLLYTQPEIAGAEYKKRYQEYQKAMAVLEALRVTGLEKGSPDLRSKKEVVAALRADLVNRSRIVIDALMKRFRIVEKRAENLRAAVIEKSYLGDRKNMPIRDFTTAFKQYQTAQTSKERLHRKREIAKTRLALPITNHIIHQKPELPTTPVTKGRDFFTTLFTLIAIPCAAITAVILIYLAEAICPRRCAHG